MTLPLITVALLASNLQGPICKRCNHHEDLPLETAIHKALARCELISVKDRPSESKYMKKLILAEHGWGTPNRHSRNPSSGAYGYCQFLNSTWKTVGIKKTSCGVCQIEAGARYCYWRKQYGSIQGAYNKWVARASRHSVRNGKPRGGWY